MNKDFLLFHKPLISEEIFNFPDKNHSVASSIFPRLISLPIYPGMSKEHVNKVTNIVSDSLKKHKR